MLSENLREAVERLRCGDVISYPTETFYGLGADPFNFQAVEKLMQIKGRILAEGIPLILDSSARLQDLVREVNIEVTSARDKIVEEFWPGPLTLVVDVNEQTGELLSPGVFGPGQSLAVRFSSAKIACELASNLQGLITATSANPHGEPPSRDKNAVRAYFPDMYIVEAKETGAELPSTIVDVRSLPFRVLRQGAIRIDVEKYN